MTDQHPISTAPTALAHETDEKPHGSVEDEKHGHEHHILDSADVHQKGMDDGAVALEGQDLSYTPEEARRVRWKADLRIVPLAAWATGLQFVDKQALGSAATYGLRTDLGLVGNQYSNCVTVFYAGYIVGSLIVGRGVQRFSIAKYYGVNFTLWGITLLGMIGARNYGDAIALRVLLGLFEAANYACLTLLTAMWFTQREQGLRVALWSFTCGLMPIGSFIIYWGLGHVTNTALEPWRYIFLLVGLLSVLTGIAIYFILPDTPATSKWLSPRERMIATSRVAQTQNGIKNHIFKKEQCIEALKDYRVWLVVMQMFLSQGIGTINVNFLGIIISGLGYTQLQAQLLQCPSFAVHSVINLLVCGLPTLVRPLRNHRQTLAAAAGAGSLIGAVILYSAAPTPENGQLRLAGVYMIALNNGNLPQVFSLVASNFAGFTKRSTVAVMTLIAYTAINVTAPQTFLGSESPRYHTGVGFGIATQSAYIVTSLLSWYIMRRENARRDRLAETDPAYSRVNPDILSSLADQTDRFNMHCRYSS